MTGFWTLVEAQLCEAGSYPAPTLSRNASRSKAISKLVELGKILASE